MAKHSTREVVGTDEPGFNVTREVIVGRVSYHDSGRHNPIQAAFLLIADDAQDGTYRFPGEFEDGEIVVTVSGRDLPPDKLDAIAEIARNS